MKKTKPSALESLKQSFAKADQTLQAARAALSKLAQTQAMAATEEASAETAAAAVAERRKPARVQALPTPEGERVDCSPYRKESRK